MRKCRTMFRRINQQIGIKRESRERSRVNKEKTSRPFVEIPRSTIVESIAGVCAPSALPGGHKCHAVEKCCLYPLHKGLPCEPL